MPQRRGAIADQRFQLRKVRLERPWWLTRCRGLSSRDGRVGGGSPSSTAPTGSLSTLDRAERSATDLFLNTTVSERLGNDRRVRRIPVENCLGAASKLEELEKINRNKSEFVATVSHELRTPLTSVVGFAELLIDADMKLSPSERAEMTLSIVHEGFEVAGIVEDLLVASRAELGELTIVSVPVDLQAQGGPSPRVLAIRRSSPS